MGVIYALDKVTGPSPCTDLYGGGEEKGEEKGVFVSRTGYALLGGSVVDTYIYLVAIGRTVLKT